MPVSRFTMIFIFVAVGGGILAANLLATLDLYFNPIPLMVLILCLGTGISYFVLISKYGALTFSFLTSQFALDLGAFMQHFQAKTVGDQTCLITHGGPRFGLRFHCDAREFDKYRQDVPRMVRELQKLFGFQMVSFFIRHIPVGHAGYTHHQNDWSGRLIERVNQSLPHPRRMLVFDCIIAGGPEDMARLQNHGIVLGKCNYNDWTAIHPLDPLRELDFRNGLSVLEDIDHLAHVACRDKGRIWTLLEISDFHLGAGLEDIGNLESLKSKLNAEVVVHTNMFTANPHEFRRAAVVGTLSAMAGKYVFQPDGGEMNGFEGSLKQYRTKNAGPTHEKPRLIRGWVLIGRRIAREEIESINLIFETTLGMSVKPFGRHELARACLAMTPGWENAARSLGTQGAGLNAAPEEISWVIKRWTGSWVGNLDKPPYLVLETSDQESFAWTPWEGNAYNVLVAGQTGSGKSFLLSQILLAHRAAAPAGRTVIIDYGASYKHLVTGMGGTLIDRKTLNPTTGQPLTFAPLAFLSADMKERADYSKILGDAIRLTADLWLYKVNLARFTAPTNDTGLFNAFDALFRAMLGRAVEAFSFESMSFGECLHLCHCFLDEVDAPDPLETQALALVRKTLACMSSLERSYLSPTARGISFRDDGSLVYFNLDGYPEDEIRELLGVILVNLSELTMTEVGAPTLVLIDELKKLTGLDDGGYDQTQNNHLIQYVGNFLNVARKYKISILLASQRWAHFSPEIMDATQTHIALIQNMDDAPPAWKIKAKEVRDAVRDPGDPGKLGYSTVALAKPTNSGSLVQIVGRFRAPNPVRELFESNLGRKEIIHQVSKRLKIPAHEILFFTQTGQTYCEIGTDLWYDRLARAFEDAADWLNQARHALTEEGYNTGKAQAFLMRERTHV